MKIYTKSGDRGETSLWGGGRVQKTHPRVATYGTLDEVNSMIGFALSFLPPNEMELARASLTRVQNELFQVGSELATDRGTKPSWRLVGATEIALLESEIDSMESSLLPLQNFILPGGGRAGAALHLARTMVRRAERECVELMHSETLREELIQYLNRLSDYLFVMARYVNHELNFTETKWFPPKP